MANYILRRDGRDYQAPDLETMRQWASDGRVLPSDMVFSPRYQSWYRARDLRELRDVLPQAEQSAPPPVARPPQQFWVRKGDRNYVADSLQTVLEWASNGNISPEDLIYHPTYGKWFRAGDSPQLASRFPPHVLGARLPFIPPGEDPLGSGEYFAPETRSRPMNAMQNPGHRRSVVPRQRRRTGPVLIGGRQSGRGTRSGPFAVEPGSDSLESADSTTKTVTDFAAGDVARAIQARRESGSVGISGPQRTDVNEAVRPDDIMATAANPVLTSPETQAARADWDARAEPLSAPSAPSASVEASAPIADVPSDPPAASTIERPGSDPGATAETPAPSRPAAPVEAPVEPQADPPTAPEADEARPQLDPLFDNPGDFSDEDRFEDRLKLFKPFYAVAKVFLVTRDMRPGEVLEAEARGPGHDFKGQEKRPIYVAMRRYLIEHMNRDVKAARPRIANEEMPGFHHFCSAAAYLIAVLDGAYDTIGRKPPERFVVGNRGRPKMHPAEEEMMLDLDQAIKALVAVKARSQAA